MLAHLLQRLAGGDALEGALDDEATHALVLAIRVSLGEDGEVVGHRAIGDPGLGAVEDVVIALS